jgi:hypothetical protein
MLLALTGTGHAFTRIKGVLIVADSHDEPEATFADIRGQIKARGFPEPKQLLQVAQRTADHPAVAVMLIPDETTPGGLETLLALDLVERNKWIVPCVDAFLKCDCVTAHAGHQRRPVRRVITPWLPRSTMMTRVGPLRGRSETRP